MTPTLPFLYLPDAVTLILLILVLSVLRSVAVSHLRQELLMVRKEMLSCRLAGGLDQDAGYAALRELVDTSIRLAPRLSPARFLFIHRLQRRLAQRGLSLPVADPAREARRRIEGGANKAGVERLKRLQTEMSVSVGTFFLIASVSGWILMLAVVPGMIKRSIDHHTRHRMDSFFDMTERVLGRLGRQAQKVGFTTALSCNPKS